MTEKKKPPEPDKEQEPTPEKKTEKKNNTDKVMSPALLQPIADLTGLNITETRNLLKDSVFKASTREKAWTVNEVEAALVFARQYDLNPITKEIQFFRSHGKVSPYIGYDGWVTIVNRQEDFNGVTFDVELDENRQLISVQCNIFRKGFDFPISVREFYHECRKQTQPWQQMPSRMLRQRAFSQTARLAYGIGIPDRDEVVLENAPPPPGVVDLSATEVHPDTGEVIE